MNMIGKYYFENPLSIRTHKAFPEGDLGVYGIALWRCFFRAVFSVIPILTCGITVSSIPAAYVFFHRSVDGIR